jgi:hypothetical protein
MATSLEHLHKARFRYDAAFHLLKVTYPMVKDPRLLIGILDNIFGSLEGAMDAILVYEQKVKLIQPYKDDFKNRFYVFRDKSVRHQDMPREGVDLILRMKNILDLHKKSPMEFKRGGKMVICSSNYDVEMITLQDAREYLEITRRFIEATEAVFNRK